MENIKGCKGRGIQSNGSGPSGKVSTPPHPHPHSPAHSTYIPYFLFRSITTGLDARVDLTVPKGSTLQHTLSSIRLEELADLFVTPFAEFNAIDMTEADGKQQTTGATGSPAAQRTGEHTYSASSELDKEKINIVVSRVTAHHKCPRCWKWTSTHSDLPCARCASVLVNSFFAPSPRMPFANIGHTGQISDLIQQVRLSL